VRAAENPRAVAAAAEIVLSIITEDKGVRRVFTGKDGFLAGDVASKLFIEMSTLQPMTHRALAPAVAAKGARLVDSPVLGSIPTVREGKLVALSVAMPPTWRGPAACSIISRAASFISGRTAPAVP